jgi:hypothetical protein
VLQGSDCSVACPAIYGVACSGRGQCSNNGTCFCNSGFKGQRCELECAGGALNPCSGNGLCREDGFCNCSAGFYGQACKVTCGVGLAGLMCSGRGQCSPNGACVCQSGMAGVISGYSGHACQHVVYNRSGMRTFSSAVGAHNSPAAEWWVAAVAPLVIAATYILVLMQRAIAWLKKFLKRKK